MGDISAMRCKDKVGALKDEDCSEGVEVHEESRG